MSPDEFEQLRTAKRVEYLRRLQEEGFWGGNHVPRGQIMPSYRGLGADPAMPARPSEGESTVYLNAERTAPYENVGLVIDLRHRNSKGVPEHILKSD